MSAATAPKLASTIAHMQHDEDPADVLRRAVAGTPINVVGPNIFIATYLRPNKTRGGILLTDNMRNEDVYQGKVGLVIAIGEEAFADRERFPAGTRCKVGDWVLHVHNAGMAFECNGHPCRILYDDAIRVVLPNGPNGVM